MWSTMEIFLLASAAYLTAPSGIRAMATLLVVYAILSFVTLFTGADNGSDLRMAVGLSSISFHREGIGISIQLAHDVF